MHSGIYHFYVIYVLFIFLNLVKVYMKMMHFILPVLTMSQSPETSCFVVCYNNCYTKLYEVNSITVRTELEEVRDCMFVEVL
jgi:hypothetical protein